MVMTCPAPEELTALLEGELTENRGPQLRAHATDCPACAAELEVQRRLLARLAAPVPGLPSEGGVAAVMARLDAAEARPARPARARPGRWAWAGLAAMAATAAAAALVVRAGPFGASEDFAPRGAAVAWTQKVGVELWTLQDQPRRLAAGERLPAGVALVASYSNVDATPAWLLAFAVDARGEVHWLYPD
jgi:anti-sigma factor RsiW